MCVKGSMGVKMYQVLCCLCYNNVKVSFKKVVTGGRGLVSIEMLVPGWIRLFMGDGDHRGPMGIRT